MRLTASLSFTGVANFISAMSRLNVFGATQYNRQRAKYLTLRYIQRWLGSRVIIALDWRRRRSWVQIAAATLAGNSLRRTVHTHCASVHQAAKSVVALLRVARVTAGLAESNGSLPPGLWLTSPAGWLRRTGISMGYIFTTESRLSTWRYSRLLLSAPATGTRRRCFWAPAPAINRYLLRRGAQQQTRRAMVQTGGQTNGQTLDCYIDPAHPIMREPSVITVHTGWHPKSCTFFNTPYLWNHSR